MLSPEDLASVIRQEIDIKGIQTGKELKLSLVTANVTTYVKNSKKSARKLFGEYNVNIKNKLYFVD